LSRVSSIADLYATTTLFVMPNVPVQGDMEGFGVVHQRRAWYSMVASDMEGSQMRL
jgi:hypothetical protein